METRLPAGNYSYPVVFPMPPNIPSSYEGGTGYVRYLIKAKVDRRKKSDFRVQHPFTVIAMLDLNQIPEATVCKLVYICFISITIILKYQSRKVDFQQII